MDTYKKLCITYLSFTGENGKEQTTEFTSDYADNMREQLFNANVKTLKKSELCDWFKGGATAIIEKGVVVHLYTSPCSKLTINTRGRITNVSYSHK